MDLFKNETAAKKLYTFDPFIQVRNVSAVMIYIIQENYILVCPNKLLFTDLITC